MYEGAGWERLSVVNCTLYHCESWLAGCCCCWHWHNRRSPAHLAAINTAGWSGWVGWFPLEWSHRRRRDGRGGRTGGRGAAHPWDPSADNLSPCYSSTAGESNNRWRRKKRGRRHRGKRHPNEFSLREREEREKLRRPLTAFSNMLLILPCVIVVLLQSGTPSSLPWNFHHCFMKLIWARTPFLIWRRAGERGRMAQK